MKYHLIFFNSFFPRNELFTLTESSVIGVAAFFYLFRKDIPIYTVFCLNGYNIDNKTYIILFSINSKALKWKKIKFMFLCFASFLSMFNFTEKTIEITHLQNHVLKVHKLRSH